MCKLILTAVPILASPKFSSENASANTETTNRFMINAIMRAIPDEVN